MTLDVCFIRPTLLFQLELIGPIGFCLLYHYLGLKLFFDRSSLLKVKKTILVSLLFPNINLKSCVNFSWHLMEIFL